MLMCFPGGNVALHKEWARASLIIASPSKPQRPKVPPGASRCSARRWKHAGLCSVPSVRRAARSGWRLHERPQAPPRPKENPGAQRHRPRAAPEAPPQPQALRRTWCAESSPPGSRSGSSGGAGCGRSSSHTGGRWCATCCAACPSTWSPSSWLSAPRSSTGAHDGTERRQLQGIVVVTQPRCKQKVSFFFSGSSSPPSPAQISEHTGSSTAPGIRTAPRRKTAPSAAWPSCSH